MRQLNHACMEKLEKMGAWELGAENNNNLNFESAIMCTNNVVVVMNLRIMVSWL